MRHAFHYLRIACLLVLLGIGLSAHGQAWRPLSGNDTLIYSFQQPGSAEDWYMAVHADSVRLEGADSAYYLYRIDRRLLPTDRDCNLQPMALDTNLVIVNQDHFLGRKLLCAASGDCRWVSSAGDTVLLRTQASAGDSWAWRAGVSATVDSIVAGNVLGAADSLKYIRLSSGEEWILSRAHGLVRWSNLLPFPDNACNPLVLDFMVFGLPAHGLGGRLPSFQDIFDFAPNDHFGRHTWYDASPQAGEAWRDIHILSRRPDTLIVYHVQVESVESYQPTFGAPFDTTYHPLQLDSIFHSAYFPDPSLLYLPYAHIPTDTLFFGAPIQAGFHTNSAMHGRVQVDVWLMKYYDGCQGTWHRPGGLGHESYVTGLGSVSRRWVTATSDSGSDLYCYEKGTEQWGDCISMVALGTQDRALPMSLRLSPNPARRGAMLSGMPQGVDKYVCLRSMDGRVLWRASVGMMAGECNISVAGLPAGMYLVEVDAGNAGHAHLRLVVE